MLKVIWRFLAKRNTATGAVCLGMAGAAALGTGYWAAFFAFMFLAFAFDLVAALLGDE
ncbi:hypothetical protein [uncultured Ruegeria sp.]|uniref:hypothetical protein n=1 Tax=uncultured Ruegeria sp. TaxID=259304 RepID=UPI00262C41EB|nr:hypothetical protein [uncultured Ruegeria sp.]